MLVGGMALVLLAKWNGANPVPNLGDNLYINQMEEVASSFNLTNCWAYGGAQSTSLWLCRALPLSSKWIISACSVVTHDSTPEWDEQLKWCLESPLGG